MHVSRKRVRKTQPTVCFFFSKCRGFGSLDPAAARLELGRLSPNVFEARKMPGKCQENHKKITGKMPCACVPSPTFDGREIYCCTPTSPTPNHDQSSENKISNALTQFPSAPRAGKGRKDFSTVKGRKDFLTVCLFRAPISVKKYLGGDTGWFAQNPPTCAHGISRAIPNQVSNKTHHRVPTRNRKWLSQLCLARVGKKNWNQLDFPQRLVEAEFGGKKNEIAV